MNLAYVVFEAAHIAEPHSEQITLLGVYSTPASAMARAAGYAKSRNARGAGYKPSVLPGVARWTWDEPGISIPIFDRDGAGDVKDEIYVEVCEMDNLNG